MSRVLFVILAMGALFAFVLLVGWYLEQGKKRPPETGSAKPSAPSSTSAKTTSHERQLAHIAGGGKTTPVTILCTSLHSLFRNHMGENTQKTFARLVANALRETFPMGGVCRPYRSVHVSGELGNSKHIVGVRVWLDCAPEFFDGMRDKILANIRSHVAGNGMVSILDKDSLVALRMKPSDNDLVVGNHTGSWDMYPADAKVPDLAWIMHRAAVITQNNAVTGDEDEKTVTPDPEFPNLSTWDAAREALFEVSREFAEFEFSPVDVAVDRRLLRVLTEPATARFYETYGTANSLLTDTEPPAAQVKEFISAVDAARRAWKVADRNATDKGAQRIGDGNMPMEPDVAKRVDTARSLIVKALDGNTPATEAALSWDAGMKLLARNGLGVPIPTVERMRARNPELERVLLALPQ